MASFGDVIVRTILDVQPSKCQHGLDRNQCLAIECLSHSDIPVKGEKSWDSALQGPSDGGFLSQLQFSSQKSLSFFPTVFPASLNFSLSALPTASKSPSPPKPLPAADRTDAVIGFRAWTIKKDGELLQLCSLAKAGSWASTGITTAKCERDVWASLLYGGSSGDPNEHDCPGDHCECGLYVLNTLKDVRKWIKNYVDEYGWDKNLAVGAVVGWGEVIQHGDEGWRAQYAKPIAFLDTSTFRKQPRLERLAQQMGCPILNRTGLHLYAKEYGERLPAA